MQDGVKSFYIGGLLPSDGLMLIVGPEKCGKTAVAMDLAHCLAGGVNLWGDPDLAIPEGVPVLYMAFDFDIAQSTIQKRLRLRGEMPPEDLYFVDSRRFEILEESLNEKTKSGKDFQALIVDFQSQHALEEMFDKFAALQASHPHLALVLVSTINRESKPTQVASEFQFRGSLKPFDTADTIISLQRLPKETKQELWRLRAGITSRQDKDRVINLSVTPNLTIETTLETANR